jgi:hypothetical protein
MSDVTLTGPALLTRARRDLDPRTRTYDEHREHSEGSTGVDVHAASAILADVLREHAPEGSKLLRLSLTTPKDFGSIDGVARRYVSELHESGDSALLCTDKRDDGAEHEYGICLTEREPEELVERWTAMTGAARRWQLCGTVGGWTTARRTGEWGSLRENLERVTAYAVKPWPSGTGERTSRDVYGAGLLLPVARVLVSRIVVRELTREELLAGLVPPRRPDEGADGLRVDPTPENAPQARRGVTRAIVEAGRCARCGRSLAGRRVDAATCSSRCRMAVSRSRRAGRAAS